MLIAPPPVLAATKAGASFALVSLSEPKIELKKPPLSSFAFSSLLTCSSSPKPKNSFVLFQALLSPVMASPTMSFIQPNFLAIQSKKPPKSSSHILITGSKIALKKSLTPCQRSLKNFVVLSQYGLTFSQILSKNAFTSSQFSIR